ncbi:MAG TPA: V-type ATP synthase subunit I [Clostridiaceae bacterium]|nr:V-type ATP synthase subunit I [Clostridiaceae bacterium]
MAIVKMNKLSLVGLDSQKEHIIEDLMNIGVVEVRCIEAPEETETWKELVTYDGDEDEVARLEEQMTRIKWAIDYLSPYNQEKKGLFQPKRTVDKNSLNNIIKNQQDLWHVIEEIEATDDVISYLKNEENRQETLIASLQPWRELDVPVDSEATKHTGILLGTTPAVSVISDLQNELKEAYPASYLKLISSDKDQNYLMVLYHISGEEEVLSVLKKYGFSKATFRDITGTAEENINKARKNIEKINKQREEEVSKIAALASRKNELEVLYDYFTVLRDKKKVLENIVKTNMTFMLEGWFPEAEKNRLIEILQKWDCVINIREPEKGEEHPILLKNNSFVQPFELITELYSLPSTKDVDPNFLMSPFFFVFFGMMVSDAGYGLVIALLTGLILWKFKPQGMAYKLIKLGFFGGISTLIWGALFGGWFSDIISIVTGGRFVIKPLWFNPLDDPMRLLVWSFIFGGLHILVGLGIKGYMMIRDGLIKDAIFDIGFWYIFLIGIGLLFAGGTIATVGKYMAIVGAILLVLTQGRSKKGIISKFFAGVLSLYNSVGYMSDVLSYSRLLALGLATGVVGSVINAMGTLLGFNIFGILMLIIVFTVGHLFNIAINALGAYVHASRLQYVEFFGKFYEGGGKPYDPFKIKTKYTNIIDRRQN